MTMIRCPHCGAQTFTITGWADLDRCATCGRPLGERAIEIDATLRARRRFAPRTSGDQPQPPPTSKAGRGAEQS